MVPKQELWSLAVFGVQFFLKCCVPTYLANCPQPVKNKVVRPQVEGVSCQPGQDDLSDEVVGGGPAHVDGSEVVGT